MAPEKKKSADNIEVKEDFAEGKLLEDFFPAGKLPFGIDALAAEHKVTCSMKRNAKGQYAFHFIGEEEQVMSFCEALGRLDLKYGADAAPTGKYGMGAINESFLLRGMDDFNSMVGVKA